MKQIKITSASVIFRGKTVFKGDLVPGEGENELTENEVMVMVPRHGDDPEKVMSGEAKPAKKTAKKKAAKETKNSA